MGDTIRAVAQDSESDTKSGRNAWPASFLPPSPSARSWRRPAEAGEHSLKRALGPINLITLGIGAIIGAGIFVLTGTAAAQFAGPAIVHLLHHRRHRLRLCRPVLRGVCLHDSDCRQRLHLRLRDHGRAGGLDHRMGAGAGIRVRRGHRRRGLERLCQQPGGLLRRQAAVQSDAGTLRSRSSGIRCTRRSTSSLWRPSWSSPSFWSSACASRPTSTAPR